MTKKTIKTITVPSDLDIEDEMDCGGDPTLLFGGSE